MRQKKRRDWLKRQASHHEDWLLVDEDESWFSRFEQPRVRALDLSSELFRNPPLLIDVRSDSEWTSGHIEAAVNIPLTDLFAETPQLPQDMAAPIRFRERPHAGGRCRRVGRRWLAAGG